VSPATGRRERVIRGRSAAQRRDERRAAMVAAGLELFGTKGFAATTIEDLCRESYVSSRNFYEEFGSRAVLLDAVTERIAADVFATFAGVEVEPGPDRLGRSLDARLAAVVHVLADDPRVARVALVESVAIDPEHVARRRDVLRLFPAWLDTYLAGQLDGRGEPATRPRALLVALLGAMAELVVDWTLTPSEDRPDVEHLVTDVVAVGRRLLDP
jgi:AcrR family transcriptional regulator